MEETQCNSGPNIRRRIRLRTNRGTVEEDRYHTFHCDLELYHRSG